MGSGNIQANEPESLPGPMKAYRDPDPAARAMQAGPGNMVQWRRRLNAVIQKYPKDVVALSNRGYIRTQAGDFAGGAEDYQRALDNAAGDSTDYRHALWSLGWSSFYLGDDVAALNFWKRAERQHGGAPYWVPYT
ncbi:MAG: tetratricopeptide repeat protein, partial [Arenimonas sp.]